MILEVSIRGINIVDIDSFIHRIKNPLRSRFGSEPHFDATGTLQIGGDFFGHQVAARLRLERNPRIGDLSSCLRIHESIAEKVQRCRRQTRSDQDRILASETASRRHPLAGLHNGKSARIQASRTNCNGKGIRDSQSD